MEKSLVVCRREKITKGGKKGLAPVPCQAKGGEKVYLPGGMLFAASPDKIGQPPLT